MRRAAIVQFFVETTAYQGAPETAAVNWAKKSGDPELVKFAVGLGLLDRTEILTKEGGTTRFLTTPHLYGELAATHGRDVCDRIRLFLDSIRHGQHYGQWYTGRIKDPVTLLGKLIDTGEIGPCTAIGRDYVLVERAGVVKVKQSSIRPGQFEMHVVQKDTIELIRNILEKKERPPEMSLTQGLRITIANLGYMGGFVSRTNSNFCRTVLRLSDSVVTNTAHLYPCDII
jgi:hypothetical protein